MNQQIFGEHYIPSDSDEPTGVNNHEADSDFFANEHLLEETPFHQTPIGGSDIAVDAMNGPHVNDLPMAGDFVPEPLPMTENSVVKLPGSGWNDGSSPALLSREESIHFRTRWIEVQGKFVDEPRAAVQKADELVSDVIEQITQMFDYEHTLLEFQWNQGDDVSTEDLRKALQHYRSFFNRLVV